MSILNLLASSNYITVNKTLIKELGLEEAVIFGELCSEYVYWESQNKLIDGMFYCTADKLTESTGLSEYKQRTAIKNLISNGYIEQELKGLPATRYFKIIQEQVLKIFSISSLKITELDPKKLNSSNKQTNKNSKEEKTISKEIVQNFHFGGNKPEKQSLYSKCLADINSRNYNEKIRAALIDYLNVRLQIKEKPLYANSWKGLLNKLERDFKQEDWLEVIYQSIERGYASFFPVNKGFTKQSTNQLDKLWEQGVSCRKLQLKKKLNRKNGEKSNVLKE